MRVGEANVINEPLVAREKIIIVPLHIKLSLMKQFVKTLPVTGIAATIYAEHFLL